MSRINNSGEISSLKKTPRQAEKSFILVLGFFCGLCDLCALA
jgi:hypothetical protein